MSPADHLSVPTEQAGQMLEALWREVTAQTEPAADLPPALADGITCAINSKTKSYRYVLPTQLLAKLVTPAVDCRCLQASGGSDGAFDARTLAHKVIVPFDQRNNNVLGGSTEPYVNNPLRVSAVTSEFRAAQKNKDDWDCLCQVLEAVEAAPELTSAALKQVLLEIRRRLSTATVEYPAPRRISLDKCLSLTRRFLRTSSGGDRLLALCAAMFSVMGRRFGLFDQVLRANITASDASTGMLADIECRVGEETVMIVEVKDRRLTVTQLEAVMTDVRQRSASEVFFIAQQGIASSDEHAIGESLSRQFTSGHNVYVTTFDRMAETVLALTGEAGRADFLREVGLQLDQYRSDISHRQAWANLLQNA